MTNKSIEREIKKIYNAIYKKVFTKPALDMLSAGSSTLAESRLISLQSSEKYKEFAKKFAAALAKKGLSKERGIWRKFYLAAKKRKYVALPFTYKEFEYRQMRMAVQHNFEMIKSIPNEMMEIFRHDYLSTLIEEVANGSLPRGAFRKEIEKHAGKQAKVIARTETAKLQTAITENRSTDLGSVAYFWRASKDIRTRPSHRMMDGVVVFWRKGNEKPFLDGMYGNAGEFPNCRCDAEPIFDEEDLVLSNYKVYNYNTKKIITMTKKQLLSALEEKTL